MGVIIVDWANSSQTAIRNNVDFTYLMYFPYEILPLLSSHSIPSMLPAGGRDWSNHPLLKGKKIGRWRMIR